MSPISFTRFDRSPPGHPLGHGDSAIHLPTLFAGLEAQGIALPVDVRRAMEKTHTLQHELSALLRFLTHHFGDDLPTKIEDLILGGMNRSAFMGVGALIELGVVPGPRGQDASQWLIHLARYGFEPGRIDRSTIRLEDRFPRLARLLPDDAVGASLRAALREAIRRGNRDSLSGLLMSGLVCAAEVLDESGATPLHEVARGADPGLVWDLVQAGAEVNAKDSLGQTPLHVAAISSAGRALVGALIHAGGDCTLRDAGGNTPVMLARRHSHPAFIAAMADCGLAGSHSPGTTSALHKAALLGDEVAIQGLLMARRKVNAVNEQGSTPLHFAARAGQTASVVLLLANGGEVNARDRYGRTAAHEAAFHGHNATLVALLEAGADATLTNDSGATPMDEARQKKRSDTETVLGRYLTTRRMREALHTLIGE